MKTSTKDQAKGTAHVIKGSVKQALGRLTKNPGLEAEGQGEKVGGKVRKKLGQIKKVLER